MRPVLDAPPSLDFSAQFQLLNLRPYKRLEEKRQYSGDVLVLKRSTLSKALCKRPQHCWMLHDVSVCTPCCMLLRVVGSCCPKFETGQTFSYVQTDATTPKIVGLTMLGVVASVLAEVYKRTQQHQTSLAQQFWELLRPFARGLSWKKWNGGKCSSMF